MGKNRGGGGGSTPRCHTWEVALSLRAGGGVRVHLSANNLHRCKTNKRFLCQCMFRGEMGGNRHFIKSRDYERLAI